MNPQTPHGQGAGLVAPVLAEELASLWMNSGHLIEIGTYEGSALGFNPKP